MVESDGSEEAAEAVENLLESYFMQIDGTYDRLVSICSFLLLVLLALSHDFHCNLTTPSTKSSLHNSSLILVLVAFVYVLHLSLLYP